MPGRVSVRNARAADARKASATTPKSRASSTRSSALAVEIPDEGPLTKLRQHVCSIFGDAQKGTATQRKLAVVLRKIQEECCYEVEPEKTKGKKGKGAGLGDDSQDFDEEDFNTELTRCVVRVLPVKKSEPVGDRLVRFLGLFLKYASDKDNAIAQTGEVDATETFPETPSSRLVSLILQTLLPLLTAKDKTVRFRATQITAHIVNTLDSIDDELFTLVRHSLLKRLRDKEAPVRVQAVLGLGRLADDGENDEDSDDEEEQGGILQRLLDVLQNDPSADVRKSLLLNLPFTPGTLPYLLERARDCDPATRRALYARLLPALGDFRHLSLTHREKLLRWGLRDRDDNVRKATARLFRERWIEDCAISRIIAEEGEEAAPKQGEVAKPSYEALLELLERVDVVNSGAETGIALEAMREFWEGRPDYLEIMNFAGDFWDTLTPESIFIARTFNEHCRKNADTDHRLVGMAEDRMPEVTRLGFIVQQNIAFLVEDVQRVAAAAEGNEEAGDAAEAEEDSVSQEFCVEQLLHIALTQDYTDEIGRRKMFSVMREALAVAELPEECTRLVVEVLRATCGKTPAGEREFCEVVLEAVAEVHDTIMGEDGEKSRDESFHSATSHFSDENATPKQGRKNGSEDGDEEVDEEKAIREIMTNMKCLHIAQCMLQNVECSLESNSHLVTMLNSLVVPAVRSQEAPIRERGLLCLGLCCLLSKNLAEENLTLFLHCFTKGSDALQIISLQIITDILTSHPSLLKSAPASDESGTENVNPLLKPLQKMYAKALKSPTSSVQTHGAVSLSKLLLSTSNNLDTASDLLKQMVLTFFDPDSRGNASLRQALSYFLPVFCHTRRENAALMAKAATSVVHVVYERQEEEVDDDEDMTTGTISLTAVGGMLVDWTDPRKSVDAEKAGHDDVIDAHVLLAEDILERILTPGCNKEERKALMSMFGKLHVTAVVSAEAINAARALLELIDEAVESKLCAEAATRTALNKTRNAVSKQLAAVEDAHPGILAADSGSGSGSEKTTVDIDEEGVTDLQTSARRETCHDTLEEDEGEVEGEADETMMTMTTNFRPDAEGTRIGDLLEDEDDEDDILGNSDDEGTIVGAETGLQRNDESLVDSLLDSEI